MASRNFRSEFLHSHNKGLVLLQGEFKIDSTQTADSVSGGFFRQVPALAGNASRKHRLVGRLAWI